MLLSLTLTFSILDLDFINQGAVPWGLCLIFDFCENHCKYLYKKGYALVQKCLNFIGTNQQFIWKSTRQHCRGRGIAEENFRGKRRKINKGTCFVLHKKYLRKSHLLLYDFKNQEIQKQPLESFYKKDGLQACNFIKKRLHHRYFPVNIAKFLRTSILKNTCEWLLLEIVFIKKWNWLINYIKMRPNFLWLIYPKTESWWALIFTWKQAFKYYCTFSLSLGKTIQDSEAAIRRCFSK